MKSLTEQYLSTMRDFILMVFTIADIEDRQTLDIRTPDFVAKDGDVISGEVLIIKVNKVDSQVIIEYTADNIHNYI